MAEKRQRPDNDSDSETKSSVRESKRTNRSSGAILHLSRLLDFSDITDPQDIQTRFAAIADSLLREVHLQVVVPAASASTGTSGSTKSLDTNYNVNYELLEVEFYLWKAEHHEDPLHTVARNSGIVGNGMSIHDSIKL